MDDDAHEAAWQRIEAALARLDSAAHDRRGREQPEIALATRLRDEQARHAALRSALRETLGRIDTLIAAHTPDVDTPETDAPKPDAEESAA